MAEYADLKCSGLYVVSILECMGAFKPFAQKTLAAAGITEPTVGQWYDLHTFLPVFKDMETRFGSNTVFMVGRKIMEYAPFPPGIDSVDKALGALGVAYGYNHKGPDTGFHKFVVTGERSGSVIVHTPYPCDFERGVVMGVAERFKQPGQVVKVLHDDAKPCRKKGGVECTYNVTW